MASTPDCDPRGGVRVDFAGSRQGILAFGEQILVDGAQIGWCLRDQRAPWGGRRFERQPPPRVIGLIPMARYMEGIEVEIAYGDSPVESLLRCFAVLMTPAERRANGTDRFPLVHAQIATTGVATSFISRACPASVERWSASGTTLTLKRPCAAKDSPALEL